MKNTNFVSLGMVILDELRFPHGVAHQNVIGGSGGHATFGARVATSAEDSQDIAYVMLIGDDFPDPILDYLKDWNINLIIKPQTGKKSTRGLLVYEDEYFGNKTFQYTTTPLQPSPQDLVGSDALHSTAFHFLARPADLHRHLTELIALRHEHGTTKKPLIAWEPFPPECNTSTRAAYLDTCNLVDIFSPNHLELSKLFEEKKDKSSSSSSSDETPFKFDRTVTEAYAQKFLEASLRPSSPSSSSLPPSPSPPEGAIILVRAGEHGSMTLSKHTACRWFPPFFAPDSAEVVDTTGAGNAFLGAFTVALQRTQDLHEAAVHASVAASFAVEGPGLPSKSLHDGEDFWDEESFAERLEEYKARIAAA